MIVVRIKMTPILNFSLSFSGSTNIDGATVYLNYDADFWFAEGVGMIKLRESGYPSELSSFNVTEEKPADEGAAPSESGGG